MVEIKLRTLGTEVSSVDVDMNSHVADLKNAIEKKLGTDFYSSKYQILILKGQNITAFEEKLSEIEMKDSDSIIVIGYKYREPIPEPAKKTDSANEKAADSAKTSSTKPQVKFVPDPKAVAQLSEFGFDNKDIMKALEQTNDIEVATEIILSGMKNMNDFTNIGTDSEVDKGDKSEAYQKIKEVLESVDIRSIIETSRESNHTVLEAICHKLLTTNPDGMKLLLNDHETFSKVYTDILNNMNLSDQDVDFGDDTNILEAFGADADMDDAMNIDSAEAQMLEAELTEEDNVIIKNLSELGYSKEKCTIAYLACNKNPEQAAQFLLQDEGDDDE